LVVLGSKYERKSKAIIREIISGFRPEIIGFNIVSSEYSFVENICCYVKKMYPLIYTIAGGPHVSLNPENVIRGPFEAICIGEGEYPTLELVQQIDRGNTPSKIENLWIKNGDEIEKNPTRNFLTNLDELPFPDRDIWFEWIGEVPDARFSVHLGRGCPFKCTYCCNHALSKTSNGSYVRFRSPNNIVEEIKYLHKRFPEKKEYFLEVETFNLNKRWTYDLCELLKEYNESVTNPLTYGTNIRITPKADFEDLFLSCSNANICKFTVGLEAGSERVRRDVLNRCYSNEDVIRMVNQGRQHGFMLFFQNMIGLPTETEEEFVDTVRMNRACQPDGYNLNIFYPYPGTKLAKLCEEKGYLKGRIDVHCERHKPVISFPAFTRNRIRLRYYMFEYDVYKGKKSLSKIVLKIIVRIIYSYNATSKIFEYMWQNSVVQKMRLLSKS